MEKAQWGSLKHASGQIFSLVNFAATVVTLLVVHSVGRIGVLGRRV